MDSALAQIEGIRDYHMEQNSKTQYNLELMIKGDPVLIQDETRQALESLYGKKGIFDVRISKIILPGQAGKFRRSQANFDFDVRGLFI
ncbi:MAG: hypothetical protein FWH49_06705 [Clostridiales bacterium]|nr:hypothetical protein [Clostridiales bacterium]